MRSSKPQPVPEPASLPIKAAAEAIAITPVPAIVPLLSVQDGYLEALPIAAAIVTRTLSGDVISGVNGIFARLCETSKDALADTSLAGLPVLGRTSLAHKIKRFLGECDSPRQFAWSDGDGIGARHFTVRLAPMGPFVGQTARCMVTLIDRTAEVETARSLRAEMMHDSLTGLPNRVAFDEAVDSALEAAQGDAPGSCFGVLILNLSRFSRINESLGSMAGDELLITVARRLVSALRSGDLLARLGGNEFGVLLRGCESGDDAIRAAQRLQSALAAPFRISDLEIRIDGVAGCALRGAGSGQSEELIRNAQFACKYAKSTGHIEIYQPAEAMLARRRFTLETELRRAIEREELTLAFQPLIDLASGKVSGFEALARWTHPEFGFVSPAEFIPVAEESGLILPLGRWATAAAARTLKQWDAQVGRELPLSVAVNVSAIQIARDDVVSSIEEVLRETGLPGNRLTLELTESVIVSDPERATRVLEAMKALSCKVAMDDFGTGYSSLAYLQRLPIDVLKIDRSFVMGMLADKDSVAIVRAVLGLAEALGMETTAEGIETAELAEKLAALGCNKGQGYYFAKPLPAAEALAYMLAREA
ncbi:putative bifunctional diguanylate cyclase/phosphodiesterase [Sphingomonas sp. ID0503]|uniref:putative bifunctional diguanylate cyclase/phosphodiesterase n=1 Tax=Sphingomonas sp. ID0503 TaxID=3399691 RepID=UPI003AFABC78